MSFRQASTFPAGFEPLAWLDDMSKFGSHTNPVFLGVLAMDLDNYIWLFVEADVFLSKDLLPACGLSFRKAAKVYYRVDLKIWLASMCCYV